MFFICGINSGQKELKFNQLVICSQCGSYGRYQVFMTYMCLSLFFIPVLKWGKRYYVKMSCCGSVYELNSETGKRIARGENLEIMSSDLTLVQRGSRQDGWQQGQTYQGGQGQAYQNQSGQGQAYQGQGSQGQMYQNQGSQGQTYQGQDSGALKRCGNCGYETTEDFEYCPKCGTRF